MRPPAGPYRLNRRSPLAGGLTALWLPLAGRGSLMLPDLVGGRHGLITPGALLTSGSPVDPSGDIGTTGTVTKTGATHAASITQATRDPSTPSTSQNITVSANSSCTVAAAGGSVGFTRVDVHVYSNSGAVAACTVAISIDGGSNWQTGVDVKGSTAWRTASFAVSGSSLANLQIKFSRAAGVGLPFTVYAAYAVPVSSGDKGRIAGERDLGWAYNIPDDGYATSYAELPYSPRLNAAEFTLACWFHPRTGQMNALGTGAYSGTQLIFKPYGSGGGVTSWQLKLNNDPAYGSNRFKVAFVPSNGGSAAVGTTSLWTNYADQWNLVVGTCDGSGNLKLYWNGLLEGSSTGATFSWDTNHAYLAYTPTDSGYQTIFDGYFGPQMHWHRQLSAAEVRALWEPASRWSLLEPDRRVRPRIAAAAPVPTAYAGCDRGVAVLLSTHAAADRGLYNLAALTAYSGGERGRAALLAAFAGAERGLAPMIFQAWAAGERGAASVALGYVACDRGIGRIANEIDAYAVWVAVGATPDMADAPAATGAALPLTVPLTASAANHILVARRNQYGLVSMVCQELVVTLGADGTVELPAPSAPTFTAEAGSDRKVRIRASYYWYEDDALGSDADQWAIYTAVGTDPDPATDTPTLVAIVRTTYQATLDQVTAAFAAGADVRVLVRVRRSADAVESGNTTAVQLDIGSYEGSTGPAVPQAMLRDRYAQA